MQAEAARQQSHGNYGKLGQGTVQGMHPPGMRMNMNPNVSKPHAATGINVGGPNPNANMMNDWNNGPRFGNPGPGNAMRSPNPNQMIPQNPMQANQVRKLLSSIEFLLILI